MGQVHLHMSMSLDGFIAGPNVSVAAPLGDGGERLHEWIFADPVDPDDAAVLETMYSTDRVGAVLMGRTHFEVGIGPWGDDGTFRMPCFVVTHRPADPVVKGPTFTFVTDGVEKALARAQAAAGDKHVNVMGANLAQQLLRVGEIDEIQINLVPVLLADGVPLFAHLGVDHIELHRTFAVATSTVTHLRYRVAR